ncbi:hypothetical protein AB0C22_03975 [Micromonospora sp. NPDC048894]|uniref:hypothetical protein n=1 Tax=unclassified Micromonospora TaxID=2617518 RepID=UPI0033F7BAD6
MTDDNRPPGVRQLRLVVEAEDYDAAVAFFRDALGLPEQAAYSGAGQARVVITGSAPTADAGTGPPAGLLLPAVRCPPACARAAHTPPDGHAPPDPRRAIRVVCPV